MSNAIVGLDYGTAKRREDEAKKKGERYKVSDEVRAIRVAVLERQDALRDASEAKARAEREAAPDALRTVLGRGTADELASISRMITRLDGRQLQSLVDEVFRYKTRTGHRTAPESSQEPAQTRGRPKARSAA